eukprot:6126255-Prymnesium_polylepis.1
MSMRVRSADRDQLQRGARRLLARAPVGGGAAAAGSHAGRRPHAGCGIVLDCGDRCIAAPGTRTNPLCPVCPVRPVCPVCPLCPCALAPLRHGVEPI